VPDELPPVGSSPNHVSSLATDRLHRVEPFAYDGEVDAAFERLKLLIQAVPRSQVEAARPGWLHATFRSRLFGFIDDLYVKAGPDGRLDLWCGARLGWGDLGVNRRRVEALRRAWSTTG
jgi:uncharacterized protein (DUF1499 family)